MYKIMLDIRKEDDKIIDQFKDRDLITIDDLLDKMVDIIEQKEALDQEIKELKEPKDEEPDLYEDYKLGLLQL